MLFQFIKKLFGFSKSNVKEKIAEIADRILRFADRFRNANDEEGVKVAEYFHRRVSNCEELEEAREMEKEFYKELKRKGISLDRYEDHTSDSIHYHEHTHYRDHSTDDAAIAYTAGEIIGSSSDSYSDSSQGEFGGAGSQDSWDDSNASDNS